MTDTKDGGISVGFLEPSGKLDNHGDDEDEHTNPSKGELVKQSAQRLQDATAPQTGSGTEDNFMRIVWILAYIGLFLIFCFQTTTLGLKYLGFPTQVEIEIISRSSLDFPAVTVCNNNPVRKSLIGRMQTHRDLILLEDYVMKSVYKFAESSFDGINFEAGFCEQTDFLCDNGKYCVPEPWICNDVNNCKDNSDEELDRCDYLKAERRLNELIEANANSSRGICREGYVQCPEEMFCAIPCNSNPECYHYFGFDESAEVGCAVSFCGTNLTASSEPQKFNSPGFESFAYPNDLNCSWTITAPEGQIVQITFNQISIEGEVGDCEYDYIQLRDGSTSLSGVIRVDKKTRVCGQKLPKEVTHSSTSETMTVLFKTDETVNSKGFEVTYKAGMKDKRARRHVDISFKDLLSFDTLSIISTNTTNEDASAKRARRTISDDSSENLGKNGSEYSSDGYSSDYRGDENYDGDNFADYLTNEDYDYDYDYDYEDYSFIDSYSYLDYFFPDADHFFGIESEDYFSLFEAAILPDFADFRLAVVLERELIRRNGHQREDFIIQCTFDGGACSENGFKTYQDPYYGNCFSFNSIRNRNLSKPLNIKKTSKTGQEYGLKLTLFVDMEEYIGLFAPYGGAKVLIHDPSSNGRVRAEGLSIPVGESTFLAVKQNTVERKGGRYSDCAQDWPKFLELNDDFKKQWPQYSREVCLELCVQNLMGLKCGCTDTFDKDFSINEAINTASQYYCVMTNKTQHECKNEVYRNYIEGNLTCLCPQVCKTTKYSSIRSGSPWPTEAFTPYLATKLIKSTSKRVQEYIKSAFNDTRLSAVNLQDKFRRNFARLEVYFEALNFQHITESPAYTATDFLSDFGGNIGLWLGWSVLALFEVVQFCYECLGTCRRSS